MNTEKLCLYQTRFFGENWKEQSQIDNQLEIENMKHRISFLLKDQIIFSDTLDMEACKVPYSLSKYQWNGYPENDPEWNYMLSRQGFMLDLAMSYALFDDEILFKKWKELLFSFIQENGIPTEKNRLSWRPIDAGIRLLNWLKSLTYLPINQFAKEELEQIDKAMKAHIHYLRTAYIDKYRLSNWGVLAISGIAVYDLLFPDQIEEERDWTWEQLKIQIGLQFYPDGVHWEQSPLYHHEVISSFCSILQVSEYLDSPLSIPLRNELEKPAYASYYMASSDDFLSPLHDSDYVDFSSVYNLYRGMGLLSDQIEKRSPLYLGELYQRGSYERTAYPPLFKGDQSGFSALKNERTYFTLFNGLHGSSHGHASNGSFTFNYQNEEIISDSGRYTYTESPLRRELKDIMAHNTLFDADDPAMTITESWGYDRLPEPVFQRAEQIEGLPDAYYFSNGWVSHLPETKYTSFYARDLILLEKYGLLVIYDTYRGNGKTITTTFNFNEACQVHLKNKSNLEFISSSQVGSLSVRKGSLSLEEGNRSNVYNELVHHQRAVNQTMVENGEVNNISILALDQAIESHPLAVYQNDREQEYEDAAGVRIKLPDGKYLDFYFLFNDVVKGNKLLRTEDQQFFYGKINLFDENKKMIKVK